MLKFLFGFVFFGVLFFAWGIADVNDGYLGQAIATFLPLISFVMGYVFHGINE